MFLINYLQKIILYFWSYIDKNLMIFDIFDLYLNYILYQITYYIKYLILFWILLTTNNSDKWKNNFFITIIISLKIICYKIKCYNICI